MEETNRRQRRMEAFFEGGQDPEGAVTPYMEWNGRCRNVTSWTTQNVEEESSSEMT
jgi:hypothetical protein